MAVALSMRIAVAGTWSSWTTDIFVGVGSKEAQDDTGHGRSERECSVMRPMEMSVNRDSKRKQRLSGNPILPSVERNDA